jgi:lipopolysaccharide transport LptD-like protein
VQDVASDKREEFVFDSTAPGGARRVVFNHTFETRVDWQTGINLPSLFSGTWKLQPGIAILNATSAGPFMIRNQFSGGEFVRQGKRLAFNASISPAFFGFFPGVGPLERIRHSFTPLVSYQYAPGAKVPDDFARALDPTGKNPNAHTDPQQTISLGISQNIEGKVRRASSDTATDQPARKFRLLSINTSGVSYNFEQAKQVGRTGWTTQTMNNTFASELLPGFSLGLNHDLWDGPVGFDTTRFDPFLQSVTAGFSITPATLAGLASLVGLGGRRPAPPAATAPTPENPVGPTPSQVGGPLLGPGVGHYGPPGGGGRAFSLSASYSSTRVRDDTASGPVPGRRQLNMTLNFSPTAKWTASWDTAYDLETGRFGRHFLRFERDLYRWHASFSFVRSANGNVSFNFNIALLDQPEIKFDYDQQTFSRP